MSDFVLNAFQMPNAYVDRFWHLLTPDEKDCLVYIARRIYGFHGKSCDGIALSQFVDGIVKDDGERLDYGTGLSKGRVLNALKALVAFRMVILVSAAVKFPPKARKPAVYALQLTCSLVDVEGLEQRASAKKEAGKARLISANQEKVNRKEYLCGSTDEPHGEVSSHDTNNNQVPNRESTYVHAEATKAGSNGVDGTRGTPHSLLDLFDADAWQQGEVTTFLGGDADR